MAAPPRPQPLFFALAAVTSEDVAEPGMEVLQLLPGSKGWRSGRCCNYPQELLLQLERGGEIHEVRLTAPEDLAPSTVETHFSRGPRYDEFELADSLRFEVQKSSKTSSGTRLAYLQLRPFALCSGMVRLLVHGPSKGESADNLYSQVALSCVELWGRLDVASSRDDQSNARLPGGDLGDVTSVLLELGIPLSVVPVDEHTRGFSEADPDTQRLLAELRCLQERALQASEYGRAQVLGEHMDKLRMIGAELRRLLAERSRFADASSLDEAESRAGPIAALVTSRLQFAALHETNFWFEQMANIPT